MTWVAVAVAGSAVVGGSVASKSAKKASNAQVQASKDAAASNERIFQKQVDLQEPFRQAGIKGQDEYMRLLGLAGDAGSEGYGSLKSGFMPTNWMDSNIDAGYNFRFNEGLKALQKTAAARGGYLSGGMLKAVTNYGQEAGSQEYMNAFNRYQTSRNATLNPFAALSGTGQQATNVVSDAAGSFGRQQSDLITGAGNARASGYVGSGNAWTNAFSQAAGAAASWPSYNFMLKGGADFLDPSQAAYPGYY